MNTLPKKLNRWTILAGVVLISLLLTYFVMSKRMPTTAPEGNKPNTSIVPTPNGSNPTSETNPVSVKLNYDYTGGFVDVFISNPNSVDNGELLFKLSGETRFSKIEENTLFEKYFTSNETDKATGTKTLRVGATKGMEGATIIPGDNQKFARLYFSNLTENSVMLDATNSSFFVGSGNPIYKVVLGK